MSEVRFLKVDSNGDYVDHDSSNDVVVLKELRVDLPSSPSSATPRQYVDGLVKGFNVKAEVRVATEGNSISLDNTTTSLDGVSLLDGNRVLVKDQVDLAQNGIYSVSVSGPWVRSSDLDESLEVERGIFVFVEEGLTNSGTGYMSSSTDANSVIVGSSDISFFKFSSSQGSAPPPSSVSEEFSSGEVGAAGKVMVISGEDSVASYSDITTSNHPIGIAIADAKVVLNGNRVTGLSGLTPGNRYFWNGSNLVSSPSSVSGEYIVQAGVASGSTTLIVDTKIIKKNR